MTENEHAALTAMPEGEWIRPAQVGGSTNSHHAKTLARMAPKGWVERRKNVTAGDRGSCSYRITAKGIQAAANHLATKRCGS